MLSGTKFIYCKIYAILIDELREKIETDQFEFSRYAVEQSILRRISVQDLRETIVYGEVIEDYPDDKYGPGYLIFGTTARERPLHMQCSPPSRSLVKIVTLYEPDPECWIDFRRRVQ